MMAIADHRQWALHFLGVSVDASPDAVRSVIRKRLTECDFLPSGALCEAIAVVCDRPTGAVHYQKWREAELRGLVDEFVRRASDLSLPDRAAQWAALNCEATAVPALQVRLKSLRTELVVGSDRDIASAPDDRVANLLFVARHISDMGSSEQSAYCRGWERENIRRSGAERDAWLRAMNRFRDGYPDLYEEVETPFGAIEAAIGRQPQEVSQFGSSAFDTGLVQSAYQFTADPYCAPEPETPVVQLKGDYPGLQPLLFFIAASIFAMLLLNSLQDPSSRPGLSNGQRAKQQKTIHGPGLREPGVSGYSEGLTEGDLRKMLARRLEQKTKPRTKPDSSRSGGGDDVRRSSSN